MPTNRTVGIALGVTTGVFVLLAIFMLVRKKHVYISFIPGLGESRDGLAARTGHEGRRVKGKGKGRKEKKKKKKKKGEGERRVEVPFGLKLEVYRGEAVGGGCGKGDGSASRGNVADANRNDVEREGGDDGAKDGNISIDWPDQLQKPELVLAKMELRGEFVFLTSLPSRGHEHKWQSTTCATLDKYSTPLSTGSSILDKFALDNGEFFCFPPTDLI
ncbi:hypothetical protein CERZMDRAFT_87329 [Cercospora zeae-maydis SCOH1-5]|uniref:Uncharacterized protein n=1 Tax=Cercospora zeae-maydis SCOH1-5 TaxID=717836 RepID=A0A6A6F388_9PEZI|nr:hypothetical protein CERZMDRAFT_87329 [Cercospora zeae-maydis SCOH1-5]